MEKVSREHVVRILFYHRRTKFENVLFRISSMSHSSFSFYWYSKKVRGPPLRVHSESLSWLDHEGTEIQSKFIDLSLSRQSIEMCQDEQKESLTR